MLLLLRREIQISYYSLRKTKPSYNKQRNQIWRMFAACQLNRKKKKSAVLWKERKERRPVASRNDLRPNQCPAGTPARPTSLPFSFLITEADLRLNKVLLPCIDESTVKLSDVMAPGQGGPHARARFGSSFPQLLLIAAFPRKAHARWVGSSYFSGYSYFT